MAGLCRGTGRVRWFCSLGVSPCASGHCHAPRLVSVHCQSGMIHRPSQTDQTRSTRRASHSARSKRATKSAGANCGMASPKFTSIEIESRSPSFPSSDDGLPYLSGVRVEISERQLWPPRCSHQAIQQVRSGSAVRMTDLWGRRTAGYGRILPLPGQTDFSSFSTFSQQTAWVCAEPPRFRTSDNLDERFHAQQGVRHVRTFHRTFRTCTDKSAWHSSNTNPARRAGQIPTPTPTV
jgi:hypothetical protein